MQGLIAILFIGRWATRTVHVGYEGVGVGLLSWEMHRLIAFLSEEICVSLCLLAHLSVCVVSSVQSSWVGEACDVVSQASLSSKRIYSLAS